MSYRHRRKFRTLGWQLFALSVSLGLSGYFAFHTIAGRYGLEVRDKLQTRVSILDFEASSLAKVKARLKNEIALLSPDNPDPDMVAEIARDHLGFVLPGDRVIQVH